MADPFTRGLLGGRPFRVRRRRIATPVLWFVGLMLSAVVGFWSWRSREPAEPDTLLTLNAPAVRWLGDPDRPDNLLAGGRPSVTDVQPRGALQPGETLATVLLERGADPEPLRRAMSSLAKLFNFRRSQPGHEWEADLQFDGRVDRVTYRVSPELAYEARRRGDGGFDAESIVTPLEHRRRAITIAMVGSLWESVEAAGEPSPLAQQVYDMLQWDIDFGSMARVGDSVRVIYEQLYADGRFVRPGSVLAVAYEGARANVEAFRFEDGQRTGVFDAQGQPLSRMFLAAPCRYRKISSPFDPNRLHPVLKIRRPHLGVDFAASTGTPVRAVADGVVIFVGPKGGNGNLVSLRHDYGYDSGYAHLNRFARGLKAGQRVAQGQVIGFVGSTGLSTGPHLHFGLKYEGNFVDPMQRHDIRPPSLTGRGLADFKRSIAPLRQELQRLSQASPARPEPMPAEPEIPESAPPLDGSMEEGRF